MGAFRDNIMKNPIVWALCIMNAFSYILRYGIENWIPIYLSTSKGSLQLQLTQHLPFSNMPQFLEQFF